MAGLGANAVQPAPHRWIRDEVEAALFGDVGIGIEGDVGDRVALGRKPVRVAEMMFHDGESMLAAHLVGGYAVDEAGGLAVPGIIQDLGVPCGKGVSPGLLEEHPATNLRCAPRSTAE